MANFLYINRIRPDGRWHNKFYVHPHHELVIVYDGIMYVSGEGCELKLSAGDAVLYPAGTRHSEYSDREQPVESCFIVFEDESLNGNKILYKKHSNILLRTMSTMLYDLCRGGSEIPFANAYISLMLDIFNFAPDSGKKRFVCEAEEFMSNNLGSEIMLEDIAAAAGRSKYFFLRQYQQETGITPLRKLWLMRCEEAVRLLKYTDLSAKEIAFRTGFSDVGHFSRRIKKFCG